MFSIPESGNEPVLEDRIEHSEFKQYDEHHRRDPCKEGGCAQPSVIISIQSRCNILDDRPYTCVIVILKLSDEVHEEPDRQDE